MKILGVIILAIIISIAVPTKDERTYKAMYDRNANYDTGYYTDQKATDQKPTNKNKQR